MLKLQNVTRRFGGNTAVADVNLEIPQGQMVGIIVHRARENPRCCV